jgi:hypothetical protein
MREINKLQRTGILFQVLCFESGSIFKILPFFLFRIKALKT